MISTPIIFSCRQVLKLLMLLQSKTSWLQLMSGRVRALGCFESVSDYGPAVAPPFKVLTAVRTGKHLLFLAAMNEGVDGHNGDRMPSGEKQGQWLRSCDLKMRLGDCLSW